MKKAIEKITENIPYITESGIAMFLDGELAAVKLLIACAKES